MSYESALNLAITITAADRASNVVTGIIDKLAGGNGLIKTLAGVGLAVGTATVSGLVQAVSAAGTFQSQLETLVTGAGEHQSNLGAVSQGILNASVQTATGTDQLVGSMFQIESSGVRGNAAIEEMTAAAEGAKVGVTDLNQTTGVLVTSLHDYHLSASDAVAVTNSLIQAVKDGNMHMDDLNAAMTNVLPVAGSLHVSLSDVEAAISTMAVAGDKGASAGTHLSMMLKMLANPSSTASKEMKAMGLDSIQLAQEMGVSLPGALQMIENAVSQHFTPGSVEYERAIATILGGSKSGVAGLELMGQNLKIFQTNAQDISGTMQHAGSSVAGFSDVQGTFNFQLAKMQDALQAVSIQVGTAFLPDVSKALGWLNTNGMPIVQQFAQAIGDVFNPQPAPSGTHPAVAALQQAHEMHSRLGMLPQFANLTQPAQQLNPFVGILQNVVATAKNVGTVFGTEVLPPLEKLGGDAITLAQHFGAWLQSSGLLNLALHDLAGTIGTVVGWADGFISWLDKGGPGVTALAIGVGILGTAMVGMRVAEWGAGIYNAFQKLAEGNGIIANLAGKAMPQLNQAFGWTKTAVQETEQEIDNVAPKALSATEQFKQDVDDLIASIDSATEEVGADTTQMATDLASVGSAATEAAGESGIGAIGPAATEAEGEVATVTGAEGMAGAFAAVAGPLGIGAILVALPMIAQGVHDATVNAMNDLVNQVKIQAQNAHGAVQQAFSDPVTQIVDLVLQAQAQQADTAWVNASKGSNIIALLQAQGWTNQEIKRYLAGSGYNTNQLGGPSQVGPLQRHASGIYNSPYGHMAIVGEQGPEYMYVPQGASIFPNGMMPGMGGGTYISVGPIAITGVSGDPSQISSQFVDALEAALARKFRTQTSGYTGGI